MSLKALFFDFGGTVDLYPDIPEHAHKAAESMMGILKDSVGLDLTSRYSPGEFYDLVNKGNNDYKVWKSRTFVELPEEVLWQEYFLPGQEALRELPLEAARQLCLLMETGFHHRSARPEMREVMEELSKTGLITGIISNVHSSLQVPYSLKEYHLEKYFSPVITSADFGRVKPHPSIFHFAVEKCALRPEECMYIGNSLTKDVYGAKNAGFGFVVQIEYDYMDETNAPETSPDYYIKNMTELPAIVRSCLENQDVPRR